jgi:hypothetical protein
VKIELDENELEAIITALEQYDAYYLISQKRDVLKKPRQYQSPERPSKPLRPS